jgi:hypothetical protein
VVEPGRSRISVGFETANNLLRQSGEANTLTYKSETHAVTFDYRRGMTTRRVELGVSAGLYQQNDGFLNGFIGSFEHLAARVAGPGAVNPVRSGPNALIGTTWNIDVNGVQRQGDAKNSLRLGDLNLQIKTALRRPTAGEDRTEVSARFAARIATGGPFSKTTSVGGGLSLQHRLNRRFSMFSDTRVVLPLASKDGDGIALRRRPVLDATGGINFRASTNMMLTAQLNYADSPYESTGLPAYDNSFTDVTFGFRYRMKRSLVLGFYTAEDFNAGRTMPGADFMSPYGPADFKIGAEVTRDF